MQLTIARGTVTPHAHGRLALAVIACRARRSRDAEALRP